MLDLIMDPTSPIVTGAYKKRSDELERQKIKLTEQANSSNPQQERLKEFIKRAFAFLANPCNIKKKVAFPSSRQRLNLPLQSR